MFEHCLLFFVIAIRWIAHEGDPESDPWQGIRGTIRLGVLLFLPSGCFAAMYSWHFWFVEPDPRIHAGELVTLAILVLAICTISATCLLLISFWLRLTDATRFE